MKNTYCISKYVVDRYIPENIEKVLKKLEIKDLHLYSQNPMTVTELAKAHGLKSFDTALPASLVVDFIHITGKTPVGHFVMDYSLTKHGVLFPITREGEIINEIYNHIREAS